jgi:hypothetical protein
LKCGATRFRSKIAMRPWFLKRLFNQRGFASSFFSYLQDCQAGVGQA